MRTLDRKSEKNRQRPFDPLLSPEKFSEMEKTLERLKEINRPKAAREVGRLSELGDFSENVEYQLAKGKLRRINAKILILENQLKRAEVIAWPKQFEKIELGHKITVKVNGKEKIYRILGSAEADPLKGVISHGSPIGQALLGRKVGETIKIKPADREMEYKIIKIK